ncbi:chemotaxis protein CheA [Vibrio sp. 10N.286.49.C2]|uniref:chemotaxis protein CheA n=1 Tax=unclassified Vibrio TaxID=2614977 RepID=UPI000C83092E|nr:MULTISPECIES: chemotaxis protein CheA [unclassified Vibrio]PMH39672.1 chemotaxis protein CheA [Vibrio sp. 10N.286.49.C2]PMH57709.1 chemotaxis protein CheA [Vibrio sp. 10N.286.49.B1]PMH82743.1 chemotaxis protein CheA [Vibrio sp. 10N.286.48.B7]
MSYELDEEILQDFLVEAGEILELLSEQLVELENNPEDKDLLNAIFRGFHTVKGGAGFLALTELVDTCHGAENVFDILRNGQRSVNASLMDTMLKALDTINHQFQAVQNSESMSSADPDLLEELHRLSSPATSNEDVPDPIAPQIAPIAPIIEPVAAIEPSSVDVQSGSIDDITQDEFERLLDELHGKGAAPNQKKNAVTPPPSPAIAAVERAPVAANASSSDITDDEFEKLLDELHGIGKGPSLGDATPPPAAVSTPPPSPSSPPNGGDLMTDEEFEKLLDELHGVGNGPSPEELEAATQPVSVLKGSTSSVPTQVPEATLSSKPTVAVETEEAQPVASVPVLQEKKLPVNSESKATPVKKPQAEASVRVDTSTLDTIMNMVGELVLVRNRLVSLGLNSNDEEMSKAVSNLDVVTADLQGAVMKTRMQPIKKVFGRFPRVIRDLARSLNKDIVLVMQGEETDLDKNLVEALADPLIHLVRNSVDHGIEMPDAREQSGKSRTGTVTLSASQEGDHIELAIVDDGGGMDPDKLRAIAVKRGMMDEDAASRLTDKECFNLIFMPGFSSKEKISDISGRGVGMDVVKTAINTLNGSIDIDSELGTGTKITIKVPLTLAILPTLMVGVGGHPFALPLASVNEIFHLDLSQTNVVDGQLTIIVRDKSIPLFYLRNWLASHADQVELRKGHGHVVIVQIGSQRVGFVVDTLIGQEEVVIKPLDKLLQGTPGMAGATITSDGHIALILDVPDLLKQYAAASRI